MSRVLITGGEGFIGRHLTAELAGAGHDVISVDWRSSDSPSSESQESDLRQPEIFSNSLDMHEPDVVVHLAAQVGRLFGEDDLVYTVQENAQMTTLIANACAKRGLRALYASTSEIYGDWGDNLVTESMAGLRVPNNLYGLTKFWGEQVFNMYWRIYNRSPDDLIHMRISMPYGPGVVPGRGRAALPNMIWQAHNRMPIPVHRDSERSWCWIGDTVRGMRLALESGQGGAFNIGRDDDPRPMSSIAVAACLLAGADPNDLIQMVDPDNPQILVKRLDTHKLAALGWEPQVSINEGMERVYEWVRTFDADGNPQPLNSLLHGADKIT